MITSVIGLRRDRKNAVSKDFNSMMLYKKPPKGRGRPSKGGQALRSKRYYIKNHLMVLQKRRLKRYIDKVKKWIAKFEHDSVLILNELDLYCKKAVKMLQVFGRNHLLYYINSAREDHYLAFMNEEGEAFMDLLFENAKEQQSKPSHSMLDRIERELRENHLPLLFTLSTLLSAYLLLNYAEKVNERMADEDRKEKIKQNCLEIYKVSYSHIIAYYKDNTDDDNKETKVVDLPEFIEENKDYGGDEGTVNEDKDEGTANNEARNEGTVNEARDDFDCMETKYNKKEKACSNKALKIKKEKRKRFLKRK
ncbi:uncharacterized protein BX663DRAFT_502331 [Cokeromyces recurvatus]|uniref:uncharacterized protein n=1 Tax=Cokeromyces recurvatus TaxID=90255 RepID=UPI00222117BB|nr:uncharacterized protein BX663DRAFT_502331 [Cokeromyces recurvatus]KAI7905280.1 hypothetical protein BX663DRAFT_502331 [Cokeromyces recurvatus]